MNTLATVCLALFLLSYGILGLTNIEWKHAGTLMAVFALVAGVVLLIASIRAQPWKPAP